MADIQSLNLVYERGYTETIVTDGTTAFPAGKILVEAANGVWGDTAIDGTGRVCVLLEETEGAGAGDETGIGALSGWFNRDAITFSGGQSWDDVKVYLQQFGIHLTPPTKA